MADWVQFPHEFLWGVATSGHQIDGENVHSDWWAWEQAGRVREGAVSGRAADHWNRVEADIELLKRLHVNAYRFSVEWARLEPRPGEWDESAFGHYVREVSLLRAAGIEPFVTLHHFTLPQWVAARGGWEWEEAPGRFAEFVRRTEDALGPQVSQWITLNEPMVQVSLGYLGIVDPPFPPGKNDPRTALQSMRGLLCAHAQAYRILHEGAARRGKTVRVGIAHHFRLFDVRGVSPLSRLLRRGADRFFNWSFLRAVESGRLNVRLPSKTILPFHRAEEEIPGLKGTEDFLGVNYYTRDFIRFGGKSEPEPGTEVPKSDMGWEIYPEGLSRVLAAVAAEVPGKPILITENGLADARDDRRPEFLARHLREISRAGDGGLPVEGYFHWSLLDNFEWIEGFGPRFGLFETDFTTMERRPRKSAELFARIAREGGFSYPIEF